MSVLVIGGAGYIGAHCCKLLSSNNIRHVVLDDLSTGFEKNVKWGRFYKGDLADKELLKKIFISEKIETVMHFAALSIVGESVKNPSKYYNNNVNKVISLLDQMVESRINNFIFSSTCATYGVPQEEFLSESHIQKPINPYGKSKLMVEKILEDYDKAYGLKSVSFRYFNAAGADPKSEIGEEHQPETHLIPLVLKVAQGELKELSVFGDDYPTPDGTCIRDYIHVNDLSDAHIRGIDFLKREKRSEQFNLGNGNGFSVKEIIDISEKITTKKISYKISDRREGDPAKLIGNAGKAKKILDWNPKYSNIQEIIQTAWDFLIERNNK
jgi:UDP-glucose 4-epimerase